MRRTVAILGLVSGIAAAPAVRAGDELISPTPQSEKPPAPTDPNDFGWQVLLADLAGLAATIALASWTGSKASLLPYLLAAPTVHALHDDAEGAGVSVLLNAGSPAALGCLGYRLASQDSNEGNVRGNLFGGLGVFVGLGVAIVVDTAVLSHPDRSTKRGIQVTPAIDPNRIYGLTLSGRF